MNIKPSALIAGIAVVVVVVAAIGAAFLFRAPDYRAVYTAMGPDPQHPPRMVLEGQFAGPLKDTIVQRWRDPVDDTVCYLYLPVVVPHAPGPSGLVQYGANGIGSISCIPAAKRW